LRAFVKFIAFRSFFFGTHVTPKKKRKSRRIHAYNFISPWFRFGSRDMAGKSETYFYVNGFGAANAFRERKSSIDRGVPDSTPTPPPSTPSTTFENKKGFPAP